MSKKPTPFNRIIQILQDLHKQYPSQNLGRHLSMALADYGDLWGVTDKEIVFALEKYQAELEIDPIASDAEIEKLLSDTDDIFNPKEDEEEDY